MQSQPASGANRATLTPNLSKRARRELGLSQKDVIAATGIQAYKLKQWEGRGLAIELADIRKLTDFYESEGINLDELIAHLNQARTVAQTGTAPAALQDGFTYNPRPGFIISDQLPAELIDKLMERMEANDDRVGELTDAAFKAGFLGGISAETENKARELIGALAENHLIFRFLQGRNIIAPASDEPKTLGDYLAQLLSDSPALPLLTGQAQEPAETATETEGA
jgi:transcriptional regulator with XRE-family HTH domain